MQNKLILSSLTIILILMSFSILSTANHSLTVSTDKAVEDWPPLIVSYYDKGPLSFIATEGVGEQLFELDYTNATHWTRRILSTTVEGAEGATAILDGDIVTEEQFGNIDTTKVEANFAPNEWLSYWECAPRHASSCSHVRR